MINKHGITLESLTEKKLELLRCWRNSDFVKGNMQFQKHITRSQQIKWFQSLDENKARYFLIQEKGNYIGCCNVKNINVTKRTAEGGIFLSEEKYANSLSPVKAIFTLYDWVFSETVVNTIEAEILKTNPRAIRFNKGLGFKLRTEKNGVVFGTLSCNDFYKMYEKYSKIMG
jgi:UDP-4-amino-4,6-dideoxy-N-acetyl-beta-L-altrosamine N-acetyltransferase